MTKYFDYAASTPVSTEALEAMASWQNYNFANPSAAHVEAEKASSAIQQARELIADKIAAMPSEIIFTSGASESNNLAIKGLAFKHLNEKGHLITSSIEHKCILNTCAYLEELGFEVTYLEPGSDGLITPELVAASLREDTVVVSIMHVIRIALIIAFIPLLFPLFNRARKGNNSSKSP